MGEGEKNGGRKREGERKERGQAVRQTDSQTNRRGEEKRNEKA